jgi:hypothetical protein
VPACQSIGPWLDARFLPCVVQVLVHQELPANGEQRFCFLASRHVFEDALQWMAKRSNLVPFVFDFAARLVGYQPAAQRRGGVNEYRAWEGRLLKANGLGVCLPCAFQSEDGHDVLCILRRLCSEADIIVCRFKVVAIIRI